MAELRAISIGRKSLVPTIGRFHSVNPSSTLCQTKGGSNDARTRNLVDTERSAVPESSQDRAAVNPNLTTDSVQLVN